MARHEVYEEYENEEEETGGGMPKGCACGCGFLIVLLLLIIGAAVAGYFFLKQEIAGKDEVGEAVTVSIAQGSGTTTIANALQEAGLVTHATIFRLYVGNVGAGTGLQYGEFEIPMGSSYDDMIEILSTPVAAATTWVTIPEGITALAIAKRMEEAGLCSADEFLEVANTGDFSQYEFWSHIPSDEDAPDRFMKCEGYLFPDTYEFYNDDSVYNYVATFYGEFDSYVTEELLAEIEAQGYTLQEIVTLASFVQEEAGNADNQKVSAVFRNRLAEGSPLPLLQSNASSYIQNDAENNYIHNWIAPYYGGWDAIPENIKAAYDTYKTAGFTPGAISNPGYDEIMAVIYPDESMAGYYYFVTDLKGVYYYGKTLSEHNANCDTAWAVNKTLAD